MFDPNLEIILTTDASAYAAGAVLMQRAAANDYRVIGIISRTFSKTETKWSASEKEGYAVKWACERFRYFLAGRRFTIQSDHKALCYIDSTEFNNQKIARWQDYLSNFNFTLQYLEGSSNCFADWLSRGTGYEKSKDKITAEPKPAGKFVKMFSTGKNGEKIDSRFRIYIPSWVENQLTVDGGTPKLSVIDNDGQMKQANLCIFDSSETDNIIRGPCALIAKRQIPDTYVWVDLKK